jgi:hypothetical protein
MDKLRILSPVFVCGLLSTSALAQLEPITPSTVSVFSVRVIPEQAGVTLTPNAFSQGGGGNDFARLFLPVSNCTNPFSVACKSAGGTPDENSPMTATDFTFHTPVNSVEAVGMMSGIDGGAFFAATLLAFDGTTLVASCQGPPEFNVHTAGCFKATSSTTTGPPGPPDFFTGNLSVSAPAITSIWVFGSGDEASIATQILAVPEPGTFALLVFALAGLAVTRKQVAG